MPFSRLWQDVYNADLQDLGTSTPGQARVEFSGSGTDQGHIYVRVSDWSGKAGDINYNQDSHGHGD